MTSSAAPKFVRGLDQVLTLPSTSANDFEWPTMDEIGSGKAKQAASRSSKLPNTEGVWRNPPKAIWIPDDSSDIQLCLRVIAHTGLSDHRSVSAKLCYGFSVNISSV